jgi:hypothetical protein
VYPQLILEGDVLTNVLLQLLDQLLVHGRHLLLLLLIGNSRRARVAYRLREVLATGGKLGFTDDLFLIISTEQLIFPLIVLLTLLISSLAQTLLHHYRMR